MSCGAAHKVHSTAPRAGDGPWGLNAGVAGGWLGSGPGGGRLPSEMWMKLRMLPRKSGSVCIFTAALVRRKCAQGKTDKHRAMVVVSRA